MSEARELNAVWLLPVGPQAAFFSGVIADLAARFDAPRFEPHLTLHGGEFDPAFANDRLREIATQSSIELAIEAITATAMYTKTLFVRFRLSDELRRLREDVARQLNLSGESFDPHLSLLYKDMPTAQKQELAAALELPFATVRFDRFELIAHPVEISTAADVHAWRTLHEFPLGPATTAE